MSQLLTSERFNNDTTFSNLDKNVYTSAMAPFFSKADHQLQAKNMSRGWHWVTDP
jgi:hypothetical protein